MEIVLVKANLEDAGILHEMQIKSFAPLLAKYQDFETSPANEAIDRIIFRMKQSFTEYYLIKQEEINVGGIRIVTGNENVYRVSPVFILPEHQGFGIAQKVFKMIERKYSNAKKWELDTILQEDGNCYLYEKIGYKRTGETKIINDLMTIVFYEKNLI